MDQICTTRAPGIPTFLTSFDRQTASACSNNECPLEDLSSPSPRAFPPYISFNLSLYYLNPTRSSKNIPHPAGSHKFFDPKFQTVEMIYTGVYISSLWAGLAPHSGEKQAIRAPSNHEKGSGVLVYADTVNYILSAYLTPVPCPSIPRPFLIILPEWC